MDPRARGGDADRPQIESVGIIDLDHPDGENARDCVRIELAPSNTGDVDSDTDRGRSISQFVLAFGYLNSLRGNTPAGGHSLAGATPTYANARRVSAGCGIATSTKRRIHAVSVASDRAYLASGSSVSLNWSHPPKHHRAYAACQQVRAESHAPIRPHSGSSPSLPRHSRRLGPGRVGNEDGSLETAMLAESRYRLSKKGLECHLKVWTLKPYVSWPHNWIRRRKLLAT